MAEKYNKKIALKNKFIPDYEPVFPSLEKEETLVLEEKIKSDYEISDWHDPQNPQNYTGWIIKDKINKKEIIYSPNSRAITTKEYLRKDNKKEATENVLDLVARVAVNIATAEKKYGNKDIHETAKLFAKRMIYKEFAPNTPTFANAGSHLQQLAACFGMTIDDYLGTDDIGEDPEKQGNGIYDILRYGAMIQKSGGGTGYNFSYTRPKNADIATTGGRASGPVSWLKVFNGSTKEINQGGFRRGANMGVLEYWHPDIFEFLSVKANHKISFFNVSMGTDKKFWDKFNDNDYFYLINPKDMNKVQFEKRILTADKLFNKLDFEQLDKREQKEIDPSLLIDNDKKSVIVKYTGKKVGVIDDNGRVKISPRATLEYAAEMAHQTGCPGIIYFDKMNDDNPTPNIGKIRVVNPCGEQPLLDFEACNLGGVNIYSCVEDIILSKKNQFHKPGILGSYFYGEVIGKDANAVQRRINLKKLEDIVQDGIHFLDNVIDMGKYPFKKIYSNVKANRKIGLGLMGIAETAMALGIDYESEKMVEFSEFLSEYIYKKAFTASQELAKTRGVFPNWKGSVYDPESPHKKDGKTGKIRNATLMTLAPNGTTGQFAGVTGGIEPMFGLYFDKNLANGVVLSYRNELFEEELKRRGVYTKGIIEEIKKNGSIQGMEEIPEDMRRRYKLSTEVSPEWHVKIQGAFQRGRNGFGVDNAVSKTVNLPSIATAEDILNIFLESRKRGCKGITIYRDGTIDGQPLTIGGVKKRKKDLGEIVNFHVPIYSQAMKIADNANKYRIERKDPGDEQIDVYHVIFTDQLMRHKENKKIYRIPREDFQLTTPPGDEIAVEFILAGINMTDILKGPNPDYVKIIERLKSATGNRSKGMGPNRINSPSHAVGLALEHALLSRGIVGYEKIGDEKKKIVQLIRKSECEPISEEDRKILINGTNEEIEQDITSKKISRFLCEECGNTKYIFEQGCHEPICSKCHWSKRNGCS